MATLTSITIENFKCIGDAVTIPIRPITLLFGKNSSGKSTVLQALQYIVEVYESQSAVGADPDRTKIGYTDLGDFRSLVHRHDEERKIHIRLDFNLNRDESDNLEDRLMTSLVYNLQFMEVFIKGLEDTNALKDTADFFKNMNALNALKDTADFFKNMNDIYKRLGRRIKDSRKDSRNLMEDKEKKNIEAKSVSIEVETGWEQDKAYPESSIIFRLNDEEWCRLTPTKTLIWNTEDSFFKLLQINDIDSSNPSSLKMSIYSGIIEVIMKALKGINYLGPFREIPSRHFRPQKMPDRSLWTKGTEAWNILGRSPKLIEKTNSYMEDFLNLGYTIKRGEFVSLDMVLDLKELDTHKIEKLPRQITLKLHNEENDIDLDLPDVGLGISQVIPVLVGVSHTRWSDTIGIFAIEEPELHLHPAAQVALGDVFIDGIQNSNCTMLIETHSEHLLLRLLRRVRETTEGEQTDHTLTPDDLSVISVRSTPEGIEYTPIRITDDGGFYVPWPEGFFAERVKELF